MAGPTINLANEAATSALGAAIALMLKAGDVLRLAGPLGAGKTTLARAIVRRLCSAADIPSPTYTLVETYETKGFLLWHFDLYRLEKPEDVWELGLEECLDGGVAIIEWPERAGGYLPEGALTLSLELNNDARLLHVDASARWAQRLHAAGIA